MPKALKEGDPAPAIHVEDDQGQPFHLSTLKGKQVVLYFYPKADTPGCTREAQGFSENSKKFAKAEAVILGVSPDKPATLARFKEKYKLPFTLLSDVDHKVAEAYGGEKYVRPYLHGRGTQHVSDR
jgi:thioredoxin-dependent peroxiredoxin